MTSPPGSAASSWATPSPGEADPTPGPSAATLEAHARAAAVAAALAAANAADAARAQVPVTPEPPAPAAGAVARPRAVLARALVVNLCLVTAVAAFGLLAVGPHLFGYRTQTMLTPSMAPGISPGDVVVVTRQPTARIRPGQVLSFRPPLADQRVVSHRVLTVRHRSDGSAVIRTKGDANSSPDPWRAVIRAEQVWRVRAVVPHLGDVIRVLRADAPRLLLAYGAPAVLVGWLLVLIWRPRPRPGARP